MTSFLRSLIASPRTPHATSNLDLCYLTPSLVITSGPSTSYPRLAYRTPLPQLLAFLDARHGAEGWRIFEFRAEGAGYTDADVRGQVEHFAWPDHHPPPFPLLARLLAAMHAWLGPDAPNAYEEVVQLERDVEQLHKAPVAVLHCKAGKGRSGSTACSYLIAFAGWPMEKAMKRFTERRMRPGWGDGVSIASQVRWVKYVERWASSNKVYKGGRVKIVEVRVWGMRDNVRISVNGYDNEGLSIVKRVTWQGKNGVVSQLSKQEADAMEQISKKINSGDKKNTGGDLPNTGTGNNGDMFRPSPVTNLSNFSKPAPKTLTVFKPDQPIIMNGLEANVEVEKRNKNFTSVVTSTAHSWFDAYFEGNGPENGNKLVQSGEYTILWDDMDGLKGSSQRGIRAVEKVSVLWEVIDEKESSNITEQEMKPVLVVEKEDDNLIIDEIFPESMRKKKEGEFDSEDEEGVMPYIDGKQKV